VGNNTLTLSQHKKLAMGEKVETPAKSSKPGFKKGGMVKKPSVPMKKGGRC